MACHAPSFARPPEQADRVAPHATPAVHPPPVCPLHSARGPGVPNKPDDPSPNPLHPKHGDPSTQDNNAPDGNIYFPFNYIFLILTYSKLVVRWFNLIG